MSSQHPTRQHPHFCFPVQARRAGPLIHWNAQEQAWPGPFKEKITKWVKDVLNVLNDLLDPQPMVLIEATPLKLFYWLSCGHPELCKSRWQLIGLHSVGSIPKAFDSMKPWHSYLSQRSFSVVSWRRKESPQATTWPLTPYSTSLRPNKFYHSYVDDIQLHLSFPPQNSTVCLSLATHCWKIALFLYFLQRWPARSTSSWWKRLSHNIVQRNFPCPDTQHFRTGLFTGWKRELHC